MKKGFLLVTSFCFSLMIAGCESNPTAEDVGGLVGVLAAIGMEADPAEVVAVLDETNSSSTYTPPPRTSTPTYTPPARRVSVNNSFAVNTIKAADQRGSFDNAIDCIKFSNGNLYNACNKTVHGNFCEENIKAGGRSSCSCDEDRSSVRKNNKNKTGLGCALYLPIGDVTKDFFKYRDGNSIQYAACSEPYTHSSKGLKIIGYDNRADRFIYRCGPYLE